MSAAFQISVSRMVSVHVALRAEDVLPHLSDADLRGECVRRGFMFDDDALRPTGDCIRAARALLGWSIVRLAAASGVSISTIKRLEDGTEGQTRPGNVAAILGALQGGGVRFRSLGGETCILRAPAAGGAPDGARCTS